MPRAPETRSLSSRIARNTGMLFGGKSTGALIGLLVLIILGNSLPPDQFGGLLLLHAYAASFSGLASFNSWQMVVNYGVGPYRRDERAQLQALVRFAMFLDGLGAVFATAAALAVLPFIYRIIGLPEEFLGVALAYCALIFFKQTSASTGVLRLSDRFDLLSWHTIVMPVSRLVGVSACALAGAGLSWYVAAWFAASFLSYTALPAMALREMMRSGLLSGLFTGGRWLAAPVKGMWRFAFFSNLDSTAKVANEHLPTLLAGAIFGPGAAAIYRISRQIADLYARGVSQFDRVLHPEIARLMDSGETGRVRRLTLRSSLSLLAIGLAGAGLLAMADVDLLSGLLGEAYGGAARLIVLLLLAASLLAAAMPYHPILYACRRPGLALTARVCGVGLFLLTIPMLSAVAGLESLGWAAIAGEVLALALVFFFSRHCLQAPVAGQADLSASQTAETVLASETPLDRSGGPGQPASGKDTPENSRSPS